MDLDRLSILHCEESKRREGDQYDRCADPANHHVDGGLFAIARHSTSPIALEQRGHLPDKRRLWIAIVAHSNAWLLRGAVSLPAYLRRLS
jgi:hypothetical protein